MKFANRRFSQDFYRAEAPKPGREYPMDFYTAFSAQHTEHMPIVLEFPQNFYYTQSATKKRAA